MSGSHDKTARVWTFTGEVLSELVGHTEIIYNVACSSVEGCSMIATASEDNTVKLWQADGQCLQTIEHPGGAIQICKRLPCSATLASRLLDLQCFHGSGQIWPRMLSA